MASDFALCADSSRASGEPLAGTGSPYRAFMLLEYRPNWHPKTTKIGNSSVDIGLQSYISTAMETAGDVQLLYIRQLNRRDGPLRCFFAFPDAFAPRIYAIDLAQYTDILQYPLADWLGGDIPETHAHEEPIYAVCAHKERDRACGTYGWEVYSALRELVGGQVWQSSHIGGHRYAGTLLAFPRGTYYGHLEGSDAAPLVEAEERDQLYLAKLRGRACYDNPAQAAEATLREKLDLLDYNALRLKSLSEVGAQQWQVAFAQRDGTEYVLDVQRQQSEYTVVKSSGGTPEAVKVYTANLREETV